MSARLGTSLRRLLEQVGLAATAEERLLDRAEVIVVSHHDIEKHAEHFNEGYAAACQQFAELLAEAREDLVLDGLARDLAGYLDDAVKAMSR